MSWIPEVVVVSGYKVPQAAVAQAYAKIEDNPALEKYEDYLIDSDPITGNGDVFFGKIICTIGEGDKPRVFDTIVADYNTIHSVQEGFNLLFNEYYMVVGGPLPDYNKYIFCRWS